MAFWFMGNVFGNCELFDVYDTSGIERSAIGSGTQYMLQGSSLDKVDTAVKTDGMRSAVIIAQNANRMKLSCLAGEEDGKHLVTVPLYNYRGYHVFDKTGNELEIINGEQNRISFELPSGYVGVISIEYRDRAFWTAALLISLAAFCGLLAHGIRCAKRSFGKNGISPEDV